MRQRGPRMPWAAAATAVAVTTAAVISIAMAGASAAAGAATDATAAAAGVAPHARTGSPRPAALYAAPFAPAGTGAALVGLSCRQAFCLAVGHRVVSGRNSALAEYWNGTTWKILPKPW